MHALGACVSKKDLISVLALLVRREEQHGTPLWSLILTETEERKGKWKFLLPCHLLVCQCAVDTTGGFITTAKIEAVFRPDEITFMAGCVTLLQHECASCHFLP